jgi:hypothetical protein
MGNPGFKGCSSHQNIQPRAESTADDESVNPTLSFIAPSNGATTFNRAWQLEAAKEVKQYTSSCPVNPTVIIEFIKRDIGVRWECASKVTNSGWQYTVVLERLTGRARNGVLTHWTTSRPRALFFS